MHAVQQKENQLPLTQKKFLKICTSCNGSSHSERNTRTCSWWAGTVHLKCFKNDLGCIKCCNDIIPCYNFSSYELNMNYELLNNFIFYITLLSINHLLNSIGTLLKTGGKIMNTGIRFLKYC